MTEGPLKVSVVGKIFEKYPKSRVVFITIKDNTADPISKWKKIGKINDWIRRYAEKYAIVRGMNNGIHFHLIAGLKTNTTLRVQKGIHFDIQYLNKKEPNPIPSDWNEIAQGADLSEYIIQEKFEFLSYSLAIWQQELLKKLCISVRKYHANKRTKVQNQVRKKQNRTAIDRILNYMIKNLDEPRENNIEKYLDYIIKV